MRTRRRVLALIALAGAFAVTGALALGMGGNANAQTGTATPAVNAGGPSNVPTARFFGTVSASTGSIAPGAVVVAKAGAVVCGTGAINSGSYFVDIQAVSGCTASGTTISFTVGGLPATQTGTIPGVSGAVQLNLTVAAATPSPAPTTAPPPPPPPPPPPTTAPTAAPTARPTAPPTAAPTVAPTAVVPVRPPTTGLGGGFEQQKPAGPAVVAAQGPAVAPAAAPAAARPAAAPALPNTGTGGIASSQSGASVAMLLLGTLVAVLGAAGTVLAYRRS